MEARRNRNARDTSFGMETNAWKTKVLSGVSCKMNGTGVHNLANGVWKETGHLNK